jgi:hypothetical protein
MMNVETQSIEHNRRAVGTNPLRPQLERTIVGNYREMPGLSLHLAQAARLFGVSAPACQVVLDDLVRAGQLRRDSDGQYRQR